MAGKIKGITIEIGGDTKPLDKALKGVNDSAVKTSKEIKEIDKALKFDPGNVVLLTQKQELLGKQVATNKEKLETLKNAQSQVEAQFKSGDIGAEQYRAFQREVETTKKILNSYEGKLSSVNSALDGNGDSVKSNKDKLQALKDEQARLSSESVKIVSSFKSQESAMSSLASEADKVALAEKKVASQSDILKQQISNLERQLDLTKKEYGENSTEANKMETELNNAKTTLNALNNELKETSSVSDGAQDGMKAMSDTIRAEALQNVSEKMGELSHKIVEVGISSVETAAELSASNAQFTTVFGDMESQARSALNQIGSDLDIVPARLQGSFTQIAAFAKTSGMDTASALSLTERATRAAADGAAFYDKSIESVTENLQSFLKGNFANDAALGISATETTRNAAANELYGKSFKDLDEAQKQLTLLKMVEDGQKLAGAFGQARREADGYENVIGNLKQSGTDIMAAIGEPILEALIPVMQSLVRVAQSVANWFKDLPGPVKQFMFIIAGVITVMGLLLPGFLALQVAASAMETTIMGMVGAFASVIAPILAIIAVIAVLVLAFKHLWDNNETFRKAVTDIWNNILATLSAIVSEIASFVMSVWGNLTKWWKDNQKLIQSTTKIVWEMIQKIVQKVMKVLGPLIKAGMKNISTTVKAAWTIIKTIITTTMNVILGIIKAVMQVINGDWKGAWRTIKDTAKTFIEGVKTVVSTALEALKAIFTNSWQAMKNVVSTVLSAILSVVQSVWSSIVSYLAGVGQSIYNTASSVWNSILSTLSSIWSSIYNTVMSVFNSIANFLSGLWSTISSTASSVWNGIMMTLQFIWNSIYNTAMSVWNSIWNFLSNLWNTISTTASNIFNGIKDAISNIWNGILDTTSNVWNSIKDTIKNTIEGAKKIVSDTIDAMKKLFDFDWKLPKIGIPKITVNGGEAPYGIGGEGKLPSFDVTWKYFAKGGILTKPTAFGMVGNSVAVGGEAGAEAVLPLNESTLGMIADRIMATVTDKIVVNVPKQEPQPIVLNVDGKTFAQVMVGYISDAQADRLRIIENGGTI